MQRSRASPAKAAAKATSSTLPARTGVPAGDAWGDEAPLEPEVPAVPSLE